jgi:hypothetical protein
VEVEEEAVWLRPHIIQMRALLHHANDARVESALREFIAAAEARLEVLEEQVRDQRK